MSNSLRATITTVMGRLVLELLAKASEQGVVKTSLDTPGCSGQTIFDSSVHLGVSAEAFALMSQIDKSETAEADLYWKSSLDKPDVFAWRGAPIAFLHPSCATVSRSFVIGRHVVIDDTFSEEARFAWEASL